MFATILCGCALLSVGCFAGLVQSGARIPDPDGLLHIYALPIGQGDTNIIQCPDGSLTVYDFGSSNKESPGFWGTPEISGFLENRFSDIVNVIVTHNHYDHYSYLGDVLHSGQDMGGLENVFISCTADVMASPIGDWLQDIGASEKLRTFNDGRACGMNGVDCGSVPLCPNDETIRAKVMAANYGDQCEGGNPNIDSVVIKIVYDEVSVLLNGDFEDFTSDWSEEGPQFDMASYYGEELQVTVYQISHHGASSLANKPVIRDVIHPKALFVSGNFWYGYGHPRCSIFDGFIEYVPVKTLCKPGDDANGEFYCGEHVNPSLPIDERVQSTYTCGESSTEARLVTDNDYAIYTTTPTENSINLITFSTDGINWGFQNNIQAR
ncbi:hypothetical protein CAPTEDRAFT_200554 [Capitella teleta]|uniref:Metallo-beta-lactamase domain-containing protein n=1 Tax=Capitella teleta TaxID=283909 RepID=R7TFP3_CAPTE|nr:hypothetical protein CAPTEDRAFT_200554 [Capitella teleta]|eukprot:ELT89866.1 hypothetical protein CAPTEDRAFT_200554 [Capitella teleta]